MGHRLAALDWMRGIAMVLMATDHASGAFNANRLTNDSVLLYDPARSLDALEFFHRWLSHLCAPTFVFLAGTSLALSVERKRDAGVPASMIDRDLLIRGLLILAVDLFFVNWFWFPGALLLQVMYAIGLSMLVMIPLRRLPTPWLIALALVVIVLAELFMSQAIQVPVESWPVMKMFLLSTGLVAFSESVNVLVGYPVLPWWAMMALGWALGRYLLKGGSGRAVGRSPVKLLAVSGGAGLALFAVLRGVNAYGNARLLRLDDSWVQWLHVSKYPPSVTYTALELGLMALLLSGCWLVQQYLGDRVRPNGPILVFGQTAFFFYVAHILILELAARFLGMYHQSDLLSSSIATIAVLALLYPICLRYRQYKADHRQSLVRFF